MRRKVWQYCQGSGHVRAILSFVNDHHEHRTEFQLNNLVKWQWQQRLWQKALHPVEENLNQDAGCGLEQLRVCSHHIFSNYLALTKFLRENLSKPLGIKLPSNIIQPCGVSLRGGHDYCWMVVNLLALAVPVPCSSALWICSSLLQCFPKQSVWACILISLWSGERVLYVAIQVTTTHSFSLFPWIFLLHVVVVTYFCDADFHRIILSPSETPEHKSAPSLMKIFSTSLSKAYPYN